MPKKMLIDATHAEECRVVVVDGNKVEEFDFESVNKRQLAGNIYLAKVTRVEPSLQAAFVDYGGNRHGFLAFSEIHPDYYQIPVADREALLAEEKAYAKAQAEEDEKPSKSKSRRSRSRSRSRSKAEEAKKDDAVETRDVPENIPGMDIVDLDAEATPADGEATAEETTASAQPAAPEAPGDEAADTQEAAAPAETATAEDAAPTAEVADETVAAAEETTGEQAEAPAESAAEDTGGADETANAAAGADESPDETPGDAADADSDTDGDDQPEQLDASEKDSEIESVADEDVTEEIRQPRKARPKRYKIQEVIKVRQILLVQVVKEERGNKGAALTTYLSLAGRYCVLMPNTARGGGISRKITNATDRKKLKDIASGIEVPEGAGLIIRTAGAKRTKSEIKRDYEYLQRLWEQVRELTLKSIAPAPIYEEGNLIKRSIRDLYNRDIDEVLVEGEDGYRTAKDFMKMIMPSHAKNVKNYQDPLPLFARYQVESYLGGMFNPTVQLKSGGYIVIGVTEALVAIDVNSGRATKEGSIEETALKTNLEAAEEVARQLRLRDLAGLIVIDFIDMEERKNNNAVEKRLKDRLKTDRARIQVGRISGFGLLEMSRQRLRPGMIEATTQACAHCHGTGLVRSDDNMALSILRQLEEEGVLGRSREVLVKAPVAIANFIINQKREHLAQIEARYGLSIRVEADPFLISPDYSIERFKTATRKVPEATAQVVSLDTQDMPAVVEEEEVRAEETGEETSAPKKRRRRRRRKKSGGNSGEGADTPANEAVEAGAEAPAEAGEAAADTAAPDATDAAAAEVQEPVENDKPKRKSTRSRKKPVADDTAGPDSAAADSTVSTDSDDAPAKPKRTRRKPAAKKADTAPAPEQLVQAEEPANAEPAPVAPAPEAAPVAEAVAAPAAAAVTAEAVATPAPAKEVAATPEPEPAATPDEAARPKRRGWWSLRS